MQSSLKDKTGKENSTTAVNQLREAHDGHSRNLTGHQSSSQREFADRFVPIRNDEAVDSRLMKRSKSSTTCGYNEQRFEEAIQREVSWILEKKMKGDKKKQ